MPPRLFNTKTGGYYANKEEMNKFNDKVEDLDVRIVSPHKFNGCGLVISSEVIKA